MVQSTRCRLARRSAVVLGAAATLALCASGAQAAPLAEVEPNDSPLAANGPIPADGWIATNSTTNDTDHGYLNLQASRQVTISVTVLSDGNVCRSGYGGIGQANFAGVQVSATDALGRTQLAPRTVYSGSGVDTGPLSWTTPEVPVRVQVRGIVTSPGGLGCSVLFKVSPASAILDGPLPEPPPRTLQIALPATAASGALATITLSGSAYVGDKVGLGLIAADRGPCSNAIGTSSAESETWSGALLTGAFSLPFATTLPSEPGNYLVCARLHNADVALTPVSVSAGLVVSAPPPPPRPTAKLAKLKIPRGAKLRARVENVAGKVMVTFSRGGKRRKTARVTVRSGWVAVSTKRLPKGRYRVGIWHATERLTINSVVIR